MQPAEVTRPTTPVPEPVARHPAHGGVMYVGPSLTRSLLDMAVALTRDTA